MNSQKWSDDPELMISAVKAAGLVGRGLKVDVSASGNEIITAMVLVALRSGIDPEAFGVFYEEGEEAHYGFRASEHDWVGVVKAVPVEVNAHDPICSVEVRTSGLYHDYWSFMAGVGDRLNILTGDGEYTTPDRRADDALFEAVILDALRDMPRLKAS